MIRCKYYVAWYILTHEGYLLTQLALYDKIRNKFPAPPSDNKPNLLSVGLWTTRVMDRLQTRQVPSMMLEQHSGTENFRCKTSGRILSPIEFRKKKIVGKSTGWQADVVHELRSYIYCPERKATIRCSNMCPCNIFFTALSSPQLRVVYDWTVSSGKVVYRVRQQKPDAK